MASTFKRTRKRKDGTSYEVWVCEDTYLGKSKTFTGKSKKIVEEKMRLWKQEMDEYGLELDKTTYTVTELTYKHLFVNVYPNVQASTFERYMDHFNKHIRHSKFGDLPIGEVKQIMVQQYINSLVGISERSISTIRYLLRKAFDMAINNNLLRINPVTSVTIPKRKDTAKRKEVEIFTVEEQQKYIEGAKCTKYEPMLLLALFSGMRRGELLALRWDNVDFNNNCIHVVESARRVKKYDSNGNTYNTIEFKGPKTINSNRDIPLTADMKHMLQTHKLKQQAYNPKNLVFVNAKGNELYPDDVRRIQKAVCKASKIPYKRFHALRHTFATRLIENGVDVKIVSKLLGHSDVTTTYNIYVHDTVESKTAAVNLLSEQFTVNLLSK